MKNRYFALIIVVPLIILGCSTKKNTRTNRMYHELTTRYNIYFNAEEAYKENLKSKQESHQDNLSRMLEVFPVRLEAKEKQQTGGSFDVTVDKTTKAIKLHSITSKPARDPGKRYDKEYQQWLKQKEFNPFLKNAWLLLGKAEYQNDDFLQASSTFSYVTRLYSTDKEVVSEARLWLAKCYLAMDWPYEAEDVFHKINLDGGVPSKFEGEYAEIYADFLMRRKEYSLAIPYLEKAADKADSRWQRLRLRYLLGQTYADLGDKERAYEAFDRIPGLSTPYLFTFNAKIQQAALVGTSNKKQVLSDLQKMSKEAKNENYQDQIYYAIGNIYLNDLDTVKAVDAYQKAVEKSTRNGYDKAISQIQLGDIYFNQRDYVKAQPCYSEALSGIDKQYEDYNKVELRSVVLEELVVYVKAVHLQDSLQNLAQMSEGDRLQAIDKVIKDLKKKEEEEKRRAERESGIYSGGAGSGTSSPLFDQVSPDIPTAPISVGGDGVEFYFYNSQLVSQGKTAFQRKWGTRRLEDDWRRSNKKTSVLNSSFDAYAEDEGDNENKEGSASENKVAQLPQSDDVYSVEYYLQQIPLTPEKMKASNDILDDAYFNMGKIYKDKLEDYGLAIDAFDTNLRRFPATPNLEEIYYQLFLIYLRLGNKDMAELYRRHILNSFPKGDYAATLSNPDYEWNLRNIYKIQDNLYQQTYDAYLAGNVKTVRANYQSMKESYPLSDLMPKFMYLNALTYAQTNNPLELKNNLTELVEKYPKADVSEVAGEMLKGLLSGRALSVDSSPARGMIWDMKFGSLEQIESAAGVDFIADADTEHLLLFIYQSRTVNKNQLIYDVADYNFSNFIYKTFDLSFSEANSLEILQVKGFKSFQEVNEYVDLAFEKGSLMDKLDPSIIAVPISADNYIALMNGKSLNEYFIFFEKNYTSDMVKLIMYWNEQRNKAATEQSQFVEPAEDESTNTEQTPTQPEVPVEVVPDVPERKPVTPPSLPEKQEPKKEEGTEIGLDDVLSDDVIEKADDVINKVNDIINNPVDGLKGLFNSTKNKPKLTKEEKQAEKEAKKQAKELEKARKAEEQARKKAEEDAVQARQDSIDNERARREAEEKAILKAKEDAVKQREKQREEARKQRERELKEREKARQEKLKQAEKERKERLKQREKERKEKERRARNR